jgi:hypothetical protein
VNGTRDHARHVVVNMGLRSLRWIGQRRGNRVAPLDRSDFRWFRGLGSFLLVVSALILLFYAANFDFAAYTLFRGGLRTARGTVTLVSATGWYEPGTRRVRRDARTEIVAVSYSFVDSSGTTRTGVSYRPNVRLTMDSQVTIEYPVGRPEVSRIRGYRTAKYDSLPWALGLMGGAGALLLAVGLIGEGRYGRRSER